MYTFFALVETAEQQIVRQLTEKRIAELNNSLKQTKNEYQWVPHCRMNRHF